MKKETKANKKFELIEKIESSSGIRKLTENEKSASSKNPKNL